MLEKKKVYVYSVNIEVVFLYVFDGLDIIREWNKWYGMWKFLYIRGCRWNVLIGFRVFVEIYWGMGVLELFFFVFILLLIIGR